MTAEKAEEKIRNLITEINNKGYVVLTSILSDGGYHLEEVRPQDVNIVKRDNEPFKQ